MAQLNIQEIIWPYRVAAKQRLSTSLLKNSIYTHSLVTRPMDHMTRLAEHAQWSDFWTWCFFCRVDHTLSRYQTHGSRDQHSAHSVSLSESQSSFPFGSLDTTDAFSCFSFDSVRVFSKSYLEAELLPLRQSRCNWVVFLFWTR